MAWDPVRPNTQQLVVFDGVQSDLDTEATGDELGLAVTEVSLASLKRAQIADARLNPDPASVRQPIKGVWHEATVGAKSYLQGGGVVADGGGTPARDTTPLTAQSVLIAACMQSTPVQDTASVVAHATSTTTKVMDGTSGAHAPPSSDSYTNVGMLQIGPVGGRCRVRPYTVGSTADELNLRIALLAAPAEGDVIYGGIGHAYRREINPSTLQPRTVDVRGAQALQSARMLGVVTGLKIGAIDPAAVPLLETTIHLAGASRAIADTRVALADIAPQIGAGGELLLCRSASTTGIPIVGNCDWDIPAPTAKVARQGADSGLQSWERPQGTPAATAKLVILSDHAPSDFGITPSGADTWDECMDAGDLANVGWQILDSKGSRLPGSTCTTYAPELVITAVEVQGAYGDRESVTLTLGPKSGSAYPPVLVYEG